MLEEGWRLSAGRDVARDRNAEDQGAVAHAPIDAPADHATRLMPERLERFGLDPAYIEAADPALFDELKARCACCSDAATCARDMARGDLDSGMEGYCLNARAIDRLVIDRATGDEAD